MKLINPSIEYISGSASAELIEQAARTCYQSNSMITPGSATKMVKRLIASKHDAMLEFSWLFYKITCDRSVTHELVRHRLFSFAQESTRYCNYSGGLTFIIPPWINLKEDMYQNNGMYIANHKDAQKVWLFAMFNAEENYQRLIKANWTPQQARSVLPNSLKTTINIAGNVREWRHFFKLRCSPRAHPQMQEIANMLLKDCLERVPGLFDDLENREIPPKIIIKVKDRSI